MHDPLGDGAHVAFGLLGDASLGQHRELARRIGGDDRPARRGHPTRRAFDDQLGDLRRLERRVDGADDLEERLAAIDAAAQQALRRRETAGEVQL